MTLSIITAMSQNRVIGNKNRLPWHLPEDLKHFKRLTMGHPVIMGRKTYESIGRLLPKRQNVILTRDKTYRIEGATVIHSLEEALALFPADENVFVIGGADVYRQALPHVTYIYLTLIHKDVEGDAYFPEVDLEKDFDLEDEQTHVTGAPENLKYTFSKFKRKTV